MTQWNHFSIRSTFLKFFESKGHKVLPSFSLIPENDPTLLLVAAGMVPFKAEFSGKVEPRYTRVTTCQKCFRADDIDNVGKTIRHHTFFEMLGNFSFGDYFKEEAIRWAWELLTEVYKLDRDRLWVSVHPTDEESERIWLDIGVPQKRIIRLEDNFWGPVGPTGPCGPCTEILYDLGEEYGNCKPGEDCDRYLELWNIVFTMYFKTETGELKPLARRNIDTGAGMERLTMILEGKNSPYETDLFKPITDTIRSLARDDNEYKIRVIADHLRAAVFLVADGVYPFNEGRGYVLRRVLRRAILFAHQIGITERFTADIVKPVVSIYSEVYPELAERADYVADMLDSEERQFRKNLQRGVEYLRRELEQLSEGEVLSGEKVFFMYDTLGFPLELTLEMASSRGVKVDEEGFRKQMELQRIRSRVAQEGPDLKSYSTSRQLRTEFLYEPLTLKAELTAILALDSKNVRELDELDASQTGKYRTIALVVDRTPFYPTGGGQVADVGKIYSAEAEFEVTDVQKHIEGFILHFGELRRGRLKVGQELILEVDPEHRYNCARHHTATHLLHYALRKLLGGHVYQTGSLVAPDRLRFDFTHFSKLTAEQLQQIEDMVNDMILDDLEVRIEYKPLSVAKEEGAIALFGEKYGDIVRTVRVISREGNTLSYELCGGTHVNRTGQIGLFKIISERSVALGIRRIEAKVGLALKSHIDRITDKLATVAEILNTSPEEVETVLTRLQSQQAELRKRLSRLEDKLAELITQNLLSSVKTTDKVIYHQLEATPDFLLKIHDRLKLRKEMTYLLAGLHEGKVHLLAHGPHASELRDILKSSGIKLGGKGSLLRGGTTPDKLTSIRKLVDKLNSTAVYG